MGRLRLPPQVLASLASRSHAAATVI